MSMDIVDRLLGNIKVNAAGCFEWTKSRDKDGYGRVKHGTNRRAHRVSFEVFRRQIPPGVQVLHRCDNQPCINPAHLFLGTNLDNKRDSVEKLRHAHGERNGLAILSNADVVELSRRFAAGESPLQLRDAYGICKQAVYNILNGKTFREVPRELFDVSRRSFAEGHPMAKLNAKQVAEIRLAVADGEKQKTVAERYGINQASVSHIITGKTWRGFD